MWVVSRARRIGRDRRAAGVCAFCAKSCREPGCCRYVRDEARGLVIVCRLSAAEACRILSHAAAAMVVSEIAHRSVRRLDGRR